MVTNTLYCDLKESQLAQLESAKVTMVDALFKGTAGNVIPALAVALT